MAEVAHDPTIFACPHCGNGFTWTNSGVICPNGHSFDRAREGYLNLLVGGRLAGSTTPGDTAESLIARRRFLATGAYLPIATALAQALHEVDGPILDVGCGEGYYLSHIHSQQKFGLDISKRGIQMASKAFPEVEFVVGNAYRLPVLDGACRAVFSVFAPHSLQEFDRVLVHGGRWVTVTPASHHLEEMRPRRKDSIIEREKRRDSPPDHASWAERIHFPLKLTHESAHDLFSMTPLKWQTAADAAPVEHVSVDVWVAMGVKS